MFFNQVIWCIVLSFFSPIILSLIFWNIAIWLDNGKIFKELGHKCPACSSDRFLGHINIFLPFGDDPFNVKIWMLCLNFRCLKRWAITWGSDLEEAFKARGVKLIDGP